MAQKEEERTERKAVTPAGPFHVVSSVHGPDVQGEAAVLREPKNAAPDMQARGTKRGHSDRAGETHRVAHTLLCRQAPLPSLRSGVGERVPRQVTARVGRRVKGQAPLRPGVGMEGRGQQPTMPSVEFVTLTSSFFIKELPFSAAPSTSSSLVSRSLGGQGHAGVIALTPTPGWLVRVQFCTQRRMVLGLC